MNGYVQVYTGNGKGKTTAALGLALRALGAGFRVFIGQFVKGRDYSELKAAESLSERIIWRQYGRGVFIRNNPKAEDIELAQQGFEEIRQVSSGGDYQLVIMDEANIAIKYGLITLEDMMELIDTKHPSTELVITGRQAPAEILERADLVTEMKEVKHYFKNGLKARVGIEK